MSIPPPSLIEELLSKHQLGIPGEKLSCFLTDIERALTESRESEEKSANLLKISFEEVNQWWGLISLRESIMKAILDSSNDIIVTLDKYGQVEEFNHAAEKLFELKRSQVQGKLFLNHILDSELKNEIISFITSERGSFEVSGAELRMRTGKCVFVNTKISAIRNSELPMFALYFHDLTETIKSQAELEQSRAQALQAAKMASLGEMAGGVAHEINTPLNSIVMCSEMLSEMAAEEKIDRVGIVETSEMILATAMRISEIVIGLRKVSRDDTSDDMTVLPVAKVMSDTLALCQQRLTERGISLSVTQSDPSVMIKCRNASFSQVILNLLGNANDALEGTENKWIDILVQPRSNDVQIFVTDSGLGIDSDVVEKLMTPFFTTKPIGKGTGLGLSISKGIVESHGGSLCYNSESKNTQFIVTLPRVQNVELEVS